MWAVIKKELKQYFCTPIGYVFIGIFLIAFSVSFYFTVIGYGNVNYEYIFYSTPTIFVLAFLIPLLTMRSFSEERKNGTEQLLLTSPLSITKIVLGKFIAAALVVVISVLITLMYYAILCYFGEPQLGKSLVAILGVALLSVAYVSFGMFASSLTENQIISAVISIAVFILLWLLPGFSSIFIDFSLMYAFYDSFYIGTIAIENLVLLVSFTALFIILTIMVLQRRKSVK